MNRQIVDVRKWGAQTDNQPFGENSNKGASAALEVERAIQVTQRWQIIRVNGRLSLMSVARIKFHSTTRWSGLYAEVRALKSGPIQTSLLITVSGGPLDDTQRYAYGLKFENAFLRERGKAFESLFARIMSHRFPGDFQPVRPYGPKGDLKCDGYRASDKTVFQSYAPDTMKEGLLLAKIDADFNGAITH